MVFAVKTDGPWFGRNRFNHAMHDQQTLLSRWARRSVRAIGVDHVSSRSLVPFEPIQSEIKNCTTQNRRPVRKWSRNGAVFWSHSFDPVFQNRLHPTSCRENLVTDVERVVQFQPEPVS